MYSYVFSMVMLLSALCFGYDSAIPTYLDQLELEQIVAIHYMFTDLNGVPKEVTYPAISAQKLAREGIKFDGSSIVGMTSIRESDMTAMPDMSTLTILPWYDYEGKIARVICDVHTDSKTPYKGDPRYILKQALHRADAMGFDFFVGPELEFFITQENYDGHIPCDSEGYFADNHDIKIADFKLAILEGLLAQNIPVEKIHHEVAPGQFEISLKYGNAIRVADFIVTAKQTIATISKLNNYEVTFMPKPFPEHNGSGMHIHFSLWNKENNTNAFYDADGPSKLSTIGQQFIAGILSHITELNAFFNPTINSYKRLVPGFEAPINVCWGAKNRSAMIRIPLVNEGQADAVRAEMRSPDGMANPYLAFAAMLHAGLDGIENQRIVVPPVEDSLYDLTDEQKNIRNILSLPSSLEKAIEHLEASSFAKAAVGEIVVKEFVKAKKKEIDHSNRHNNKQKKETHLEG